MTRRATRLDPTNIDYDTLFELSDTPTLELDGAGVVQRANAAVARMFDTSPERARGTTLDALLGVDATAALDSDRPVTLQVATAAGRVPLVVRSTRRDLRGSDGARFTVQLGRVSDDEHHVAPRSGDPSHWSAMDDVSHSLGTPLSIIAGYAETLVSHAGDLDTDGVVRAAAAIRRHADRAIDELHALQARIRLDAGGAGTVPTVVLMAWLRRMLEPNLIAASAALVGQWTTDIVVVDVAVARQALLNLCRTALQMQPPPSLLELQVSVDDAGTTFVLDAPVRGPVGWSADAEVSMDVTASLVSRHGGTYERPTPEHTTQRLLLPPTARAAPASSATPTIPVVVIEDDEDTAVLIRSSLRNSSTLFRVEADARTFADGLEAVRRTQPRIVLLDQHLPDRTGTEGLADLRAAAPDARIVVLSVHGRPPEATEDVAVWLEKDRVLADLGSQLVGVLAAQE